MNRLSPTAGNVHEMPSSEHLLHGEEARVRDDAGYGGIEKSPRHHDLQVAWHIALRAGWRRKLARDQQERLMEECKSSVRSKAEHIFFNVKKMFG